MSSLHDKFGPFKSRLIALNVHDAVMRLVEGGCDLLIAYHHPSQPFQLDADRYEMVSLGQEVLSPYSKADAEGQRIGNPTTGGRLWPRFWASQAFRLSLPERLISASSPRFFGLHIFWQ